MRAAGCGGAAGPGAPGGEGAGTEPPDQTCPSRLPRVPAAPSRRGPSAAGTAFTAAALPARRRQGRAVPPGQRSRSGSVLPAPAHLRPAGPALPELPAGNAPSRRGEAPAAAALRCPGQPPLPQPVPRTLRAPSSGGTAAVRNASSPLVLPVLPPSVMVAWSETTTRMV